MQIQHLFSLGCVLDGFGGQYRVMLADKHMILLLYR